MNNEQQTDFKWTISHLLAMTTIVAVLCAGALWLGNAYAYVATIPTFLLAVVLVGTRGRTLIGTGVGALALLFLASTVLVQFDSTDPRYLKATVLLGLFGSVFGASIHSLRLNRYVLGSCGLAVGLFSLMAICMMTAPDQPALRTGSPTSAPQNNSLQPNPSNSGFDLR